MHFCSLTFTIDYYASEFGYRCVRASLCAGTVQYTVTIVLYSTALTSIVQPVTVLAVCSIRLIDRSICTLSSFIFILPFSPELCKCPPLSCTLYIVFCFLHLSYVYRFQLTRTFCSVESSIAFAYESIRV